MNPHPNTIIQLIHFPSFLAHWWYHSVIIYSYAIVYCVAGRGATTAVELLAIIWTTFWLLPVPRLLASEVGVEISHEVLDMTMPVAGLIHWQFFNFHHILSLSFEGKLAWHFKSSSDKISWMSLATHNGTLNRPQFRRNSEQAAEIFFDTWPIVLPALTTDMVNRLNGFPSSQRHGNVCPQLASQISW